MKTFPVGTLAVSDPSNYNTPTYNSAQLTVEKANVTINPGSVTKSYGTNDPTLVYSETGLVQNVMADGINLNDSLTGSLTRDSYGSLAGEQIGEYTIQQGTVAIMGSAADNYNINMSLAHLTITPASLSIVANPAKGIANQPDPIFTYRVYGLVNGVTVDGVTINDSMNNSLAGMLNRTNSSDLNPGVYTILQGTLTASNYSISYTPADYTIVPPLSPEKPLYDNGIITTIVRGGQITASDISNNITVINQDTNGFSSIGGYGITMKANNSLGANRVSKEGNIIIFSIHNGLNRAEPNNIKLNLPAFNIKYNINFNNFMNKHPFYLLSFHKIMQRPL